MREIRSSAFGEVAQPESFDDLIELLMRPHREWGRVWMWRGQADAEWPVHSSAYRRLRRGQGEVLERDVAHYEENLLTQATHRGFRYQEGRRLSDLELLARLQHHGAATRLVDMTKSALVGLYFACLGAAGRTGALIGVHSAYLGGYESEPNEDEYATVMKGLEDLDHPMTWEPTGVSSRVAAQHSQFLYSAVVDRPTGSLALPEGDNTRVIAIDEALKPLFLKTLSDVFDIRAQSLFPDIDGFGVANSHEIPSDQMFRW